MIVVLEGANGVGKSTYAELLEVELGLKRCRPFKDGDANLHWGVGERAGQLYGDLIRCGIPVNTHVDDMYVADFLRTFKVGAILDRSLPSAIAYRTLPNMECSLSDLMLLWQRMLIQAPRPLLYVWMKASHPTAKQRCKGRWFPSKAEYRRLEREFEKVFRRIGFKKMCVDTTDLKINDGIRRICQTLRH